jgi:hypothetical protein
VKYLSLLRHNFVTIGIGTYLMIIILFPIFVIIKIIPMIVITLAELKTNQNKYFDLAEKEKVVVRRGGKIIELVLSDEVSTNLSPSADP